ncbi:MAG: RNA polymerase sigma factor [Verrucomicrobiota bacterium]
MNEDAQSTVLLALAQQGDSDAFCELCRLNEARLLRQAMALCGDATFAEDLAQDTLVAAWKSIRRYNGKCRFFTWLCSILIHLHRSGLRKKQPSDRLIMARDDIAFAEDCLANLADDAAYPDEALDLSEQAAMMRVCLENLPKKHRDVIFLRFYVNESLDGIATALNCSVGTVKSRLFHGLEKLRKMKGLTVNFHENKKFL